MMSGTPVVATEVGSVRDQLDGYGVLVQAGSAKTLAAGIQRIISEYDVHSEQSLEMSRSARQRFSVETMVARHEDMYRAVAATGRQIRRHSPRNRSGTSVLRQALRTLNKIRPQVRSKE
jgi:glycosyltransferase involved in cell wall biosynthesis